MCLVTSKSEDLLKSRQKSDGNIYSASLISVRDTLFVRRVRLSRQYFKHNSFNFEVKKPLPCMHQQSQSDLMFDLFLGLVALTRPTHRAI